jgi:alanine racemase
MKIFRPIWAEIDCDNLAHNLTLLRNLANPAVKIIAVVKADAYGHGAVQAAKVLDGAGADMFAVASLEEAMQIREAGIDSDILILGYTQPEWAATVVEGGFIQTVYHLGLAKALQKEADRLGKTVRVHVKIDTGMSRIGLMPEKAVYFVKEIAGIKELVLDGIYTHFSCADDPANDFSKEQLERFEEFLAQLDKHGIARPRIHIGNSATIIRYPEAHFDMVRPGILLYGLYPSPEMAKQFPHDFRPVMSIKTSIVEIKTVPAGARISYGGTFVTQRPTRIATMPAGYADGFSRNLSNRGHVLVQGQRAPIVGNVCMDFLMADVTDVPDVSVNDEVVLVGKLGAERITFDEIAAHMGTINYEAVSLIGKRVPRVYTNYTGGNPAEL